MDLGLNPVDEGFRLLEWHYSIPKDVNVSREGKATTKSRPLPSTTLCEGQDDATFGIETLKNSKSGVNYSEAAE